MCAVKFYNGKTHLAWTSIVRYPLPSFTSCLMHPQLLFMQLFYKHNKFICTHWYAVNILYTFHSYPPLTFPLTEQCTNIYFISLHFIVDCFFFLCFCFTCRLTATGQNNFLCTLLKIFEKCFSIFAKIRNNHDINVWEGNWVCMYILIRCQFSVKIIINKMSMQMKGRAASNAYEQLPCKKAKIKYSNNI